MTTVKLVMLGNNRIDAAAGELAAYAMFLSERDDICLRCLLAELTKFINEGIATGQLVHGENMPVDPTDKPSAEEMH